MYCGGLVQAWVWSRFPRSSSWCTGRPWRRPPSVDICSLGLALLDLLGDSSSSTQPEGADALMWNPPCSMAFLAGEAVSTRYAACRAPGTYLSCTTVHEYRELANAQVAVTLPVLAIRASPHLGSHPRHGYQRVIR